MKLPLVASRALAKLAHRNMQLHCTIQAEQLWVADASDTVQIERTMVKIPPPV